MDGASPASTSKASNADALAPHVDGLTLEDGGVRPCASREREPGAAPPVRIVPYGDERDLVKIMRMVSEMLSEPYSIFTYRYFIYNWPELCFIAQHDWQEAPPSPSSSAVAENGSGGGEEPPPATSTTPPEAGASFCGTVVCKVDELAGGRRRGYIAMLAVDRRFRRERIGTRLVSRAIEQMEKMHCDEVILETEITNVGALNLYERLGFIRERRLHRYYLNGVDAYRLKLWFRMPDDERCAGDYEPLQDEAECHGDGDFEPEPGGDFDPLPSGSPLLNCGVAALNSHHAAAGGRRDCGDKEE